MSDDRSVIVVSVVRFVSDRRATSKRGVSSAPNVAESGIHPGVRMNGKSIYRRPDARKIS